MWKLFEDPNRLNEEHIAIKAPYIYAHMAHSPQISHILYPSASIALCTSHRWNAKSHVHPPTDFFAQTPQKCSTSCTRGVRGLSFVFGIYHPNLNNSISFGIIFVFVSRIFFTLSLCLFSRGYQHEIQGGLQSA